LPIQHRRWKHHDNGKRSEIAGRPSPQSERGLDWLNFFMADVQSGFGAFLSFYLADLHWTKAAVGLALTSGGLAGVAAQMPAGAVVDAIATKRAVVALGAAMVAASALVLALWPNFVLVMIAEILHGATAGLIGPAIAAISLGLVGRRAMAARVGRNYRFDAAGNAITAAALGALAYYVSEPMIFYATAALTVPVFVALSRIRGEEIDYARARNAADRGAPRRAHPFRQIFRNPALLVFATAAVLFRFADASLLPVESESIGRSPLLLAALIAVPQLVVAVLAPWIGHAAEAWGRRPVLLAGFALEPLRAILFAFVTNSYWLSAIQVIDGITGATITVMTILVLTDLTAGTGRFNFVRGTVGTLTGIAASVSTTATGFISDRFGESTGFLAMAVVAATGAVILWLWMPESRPKEYTD
jgi:MFS family permease